VERMTNEEEKILTLSKLIDEEFTDLQTRAVLVNLLLFVFNDNEYEAVQHLEKLKSKFNEKEFK
jgi:hypothetical protein